MAGKCDFLEICYLLLKASCPTQAEGEFNSTVMNHTQWCHEQMQFFLRGFRRDAHPMAC